MFKILLSFKLLKVTITMFFRSKHLPRVQCALSKVHHSTVTLKMGLVKFSNIHIFVFSYKNAETLKHRFVEEKALVVIVVINLNLKVLVHVD